MPANDNLTSDLHQYLTSARGAMVWKLEHLTDYDLRRPLTPTGTNLLGLVKHLTGVEMLYFGVAFGRPHPSPPDWFGEHMEPNADMWATANETSTAIIDAYHSACAHADATIGQLGAGEVGFVPWFADGQVTLHRLLVHVLAETERHAGHADIVRELIDGAIGRQPGNDQLDTSGNGATPRDEQTWNRLHDRIQQAAAESLRVTR